MSLPIDLIEARRRRYARRLAIRQAGAWLLLSIIFLGCCAVFAAVLIGFLDPDL